MAREDGPGGETEWTANFLATKVSSLELPGIKGLNLGLGTSLIGLGASLTGVSLFSLSIIMLSCLHRCPLFEVGWAFGKLR